ncbi:MAG: hypothetical protein Q9215_000907 [Flavoplaca cf. flavocitrina]
MRLTCLLSCIFVVLTAVPLAYSLPTIEAVRSTSSSTTESVRGDGREPHHLQHLHRRRAEIHELEKRQQVNCTDPQAFFFEECWRILNVHDYLVNPETGWIATTRICQDSGGRNEDNNGPINNFFKTYFDALNNAAGIVGNNIEKMIEIVDVVVEPDVPFQEILLTLAVGLAFLGAPSFAIKLLSIKLISFRASAQALIISSQQAPNVGRALWPVGTDQSRFIQTGELRLQLANISTAMSAMMDGGVRLLMTNIGTFANYADNGRYSGPNVTDTGEGSPLTVPSAGDAVAYALKTFLLSYSLWKNNWYATFHLGPYPTAEDVRLAFNCEIQADTGLCGTTGARYWSPYTQRVYELKVEGPDEALEPREMVQTMLAYGWAPLSVLFDGAWNCTSEGRAGSSAVNFNYDGTLDLACVSQLPMYTNCGDMCPTTRSNGSCLFGTTDVVKPGSCDSWQDLWS